MISILNILKIVAGHGPVVQPASINIVFVYKQAQQYSRIHKLDFVRAVRVHKMLNRVGHTCISPVQ